MRVAIFGATGRTGRLLVQQALDEGQAVTAVVRDAQRLGVRHPALSLALVPELDDMARVRRAVAGAAVVFSAIGPRGRKDAPVAAPATASILAALTETPAPRIVVISAAPVGPPPEDDGFLNRRIMMPLVGAMLRPVYSDLRSMEAHLAASGATWTAFRPPKLTDGPRTGHYRTARGRGVPRGYSLSRADLAHAMLAAPDHAETENTAVGIAY